MQNAFIESFNSKLRDECLNEHFFFGLAEARHLIEAWRQDYNQIRPHSSLGALAPVEYANRQGGGPPEQAQGSATRPLAPPPRLEQNINPGLYSEMRLRWGQTSHHGLNCRTASFAILNIPRERLASSLRNYT